MYFVMQATFDCLLKTYGFLTPDFWTETRFIKSPFQEFTDLLAKPTKTLVLEDVERVEAWLELGILKDEVICPRVVWIA